MHKTKLLKLLGISLIVGILGLTGFCKKSKDNNDSVLVAGLVVAEQQAQQAAQAAQQAAYEAANNRENPEFFCAYVIKKSNVTYYEALLLPLVEQDCNQYPASILGSSTDELKQKLLNTINNDPDLNTSCPNTRSAISNFDFSTPPSDGGSVQIKNTYKGKSLLSEVGLSTKDYTVVSPNAYKLSILLSFIDYFAKNLPETTCQNAIQNKLNSIEYDKFCYLTFTSSTCPTNKTKVAQAQCAYGSGVPSNYIKCETLNDQF
jgi:hypothetical protein